MNGSSRQELPSGYSFLELRASSRKWMTSKDLDLGRHCYRWRQRPLQKSTLHGCFNFYGRFTLEDPSSKTSFVSLVILIDYYYYYKGLGLLLWLSSPLKSPSLEPPRLLPSLQLLLLWWYFRSPNPQWLFYSIWNKHIKIINFSDYQSPEIQSSPQSVSSRIPCHPTTSTFYYTFFRFWVEPQLDMVNLRSWRP